MLYANLLQCVPGCGGFVLVFFSFRQPAVMKNLSRKSLITEQKRELRFNHFLILTVMTEEFQGKGVSNILKIGSKIQEENQHELKVFAFSMMFGCLPQTI